MPMATEFVCNRRQWLATVVAAASGVALPTAGAATPVRLAATWQCGAGYQVGVLEARDRQLMATTAIDVPTRAHALIAEPGGTLLTVARRPGDWLLRWRPDGEVVRQAWAEPDRAFNGHALRSADGRCLYTTETDLETGNGLIGVRDAGSLEKLAEWPTGGADPHAMLLDARGDLVVANGGIRTLPETGRIKLDLDRMDSSLARLSARDGALTGAWRVNDRRLSLRHLAWVGEPGGVLAIAMQAEHDDTQRKAAAPVLALWDGRSVRALDAEVGLAGYGGDVACSAGVIAVSCPRANGVALWSGNGDWRRLVPLPEACALAPHASGGWWVGGAPEWLRHDGVAGALPAGLRLDNHWLRLSA